jgi:hypothetical protein
MIFMKIKESLGLSAIGLGSIAGWNLGKKLGDRILNGDEGGRWILKGLITGTCGGVGLLVGAAICTKLNDEA